MAKNFTVQDAQTAPFLVTTKDGKITKVVFPHPVQFGLKDGSTAGQLVSDVGLVFRTQTVASTPFYVGQNDIVIAVNVTNAPITVNLPASPTPGQLHIIKDVNGSASSYNITIVAAGNDTVDGSSSYAMAISHEVVGLVWTGTTWSKIMMTSSGGGGGGTGVNAYTTTSLSFTQPAASATVNVTVGNSSWMSVGQTVYVNNGGYYTVTAIPDSTHVTLNNLGYAGNAAQSSTVSSSSSVSAAGIQGSTGTAGSSGANGVNAYTTTASNFTQPSASSTVSVQVGNSVWISVGQSLYISGAGYYTVTAIPDSTHVTVQNLGYAGNASAGTTINSGATVSASGISGASSFSSGIDTARPAASTAMVGNVYYATDTGISYQCVNSSTWTVIGMSNPKSDKATFGPFSSSNFYSTATGLGYGPAPTVAGSFSWAIGMYVESLPTGTKLFWSYTDGGGAPSGWTVGALSGNLVIYINTGTWTPYTLSGATITTGPHVLAISWQAGGASLHYAWDGTTQTPVATTAGLVAPNSSAAHYIGAYPGGLADDWASLSWLQAWSSALSDSDLQTISASPTTYRPSTVTGTLVFDWRASAHRSGDNVIYPTGSQSARLVATGPTGINKTYR